MKKDKLRARVFDSAWEIVSTQGLAQLSVRKIAQRSACSVGSIYNAFESFQELQFHIKWKILEGLFTLFKQKIAEGMERQINPQALLKELAYAYIQFGKSNPFHWKAVFEHFTDGPLPNWYALRIQEEAHNTCVLLAQHFNVNAAIVVQKIGFFWAAIHGMNSILLNRKLEALTELALEESIANYIDYSLHGLF